MCIYKQNFEESKSHGERRSSWFVRFEEEQAHDFIMICRIDHWRRTRDRHNSIWMIWWTLMGEDGTALQLLCALESPAMRITERCAIKLAISQNRRTAFLLMFYWYLLYWSSIYLMISALPPYTNFIHILRQIQIPRWSESTPPWLEWTTWTWIDIRMARGWLCIECTSSVLQLLFNCSMTSPQFVVFYWFSLPYKSPYATLRCLISWSPRGPRQTQLSSIDVVCVLIKLSALLPYVWETAFTYCLLRHALTASRSRLEWTWPWSKWI